MSVRPGKTAPRLLQDLLTYDPRYEHGFGRNVLSDPPPLFDPSIQPSPFAVPPQGCRHALMAKYTQSKLAEPGETPDTSTVYKVASYCNQCRFHFDITVDFGGQLYNSHPCPNDDFPLHHFLYMPDRNQNNAGPPLTPEERTYRFQCSGKECPVELRIRIRPPIFKTAWVDLLTNPAYLQARLQAAMQADPERVELRVSKPTDGLYYLGRYLGDALDTEHNKKKIPLRNRKFMVTFGQDCDTMLRELGFEREESEEGINWNLPNAGPLTDPLEGDTLRTKLEDVMEELNALLLKRPSSEQKTMANPPRQPIPCLKDIERALGCLDYSKNTSARRSQNKDAPEHPYYAGLGALVAFSDSLIIFAFERQAENDPINVPYYFECLEDLAQGRESEELQLKVMTLMSQGQTNRRQIREAYKYFNIDPDMSASSDTFIINQFRARLSDVSSKQEGEMREMLRVLGQARQSSTILQEASNAIETFAQANSWLGVEETTDIDYIATMAQLKAGESESSKASVLKAVEIIANHRNSDSLRSFLTTGQLGETEMDLAEAYRILDIPDRTQRLDQELLQTLLELRTTDSTHPADKLQKAYALISKSQFGQADDDTTQESKYPLDKWPVGFQNIGNTCYLNSLLQYFFTIKPLRQLVLNFEKYKLELTEENTFKKRVGGREVSVEEVEKAQEFVRELKKLFVGMITSPGPSVRPEVRLACLALLSSKDESSEKQVSNGESSSAGLGTLGGMPVSGPMLPLSQLMSGYTSSSQTEVGDAGSEGTLVGDASDNGSPKLTIFDGQDDVVEIQPRVLEGATPPSSSQMSIEKGTPESDSESARAVNGEVAPEPPTRPPPVPPRPKQVDTPRTTVPADVEFAARQQDVAEVMNKVVFQLQCAIKPQVLANGQSIDLTKRLFFGETTTTHTRNKKIEQRKETWDTLFVNVNEGPRDIYSALDEEFDVGDIEEESQQTADNGILRKYENISTLPPILQINVKRVNYDSKKREAFKSHNHLHLEQTLFVDRYLEQTPTISREDLFERRLKSWEWKKQLKVYRQRQEELKALENGFELADTVDVAADFISGLATPPQRDDGNPTEDSVLALALKKRAVELRQEQQTLTEQITALQYNIDHLFADLRDQPYQLHAIFIHRGSAGGGHYYVYIRDFQQGVWRKYNDTKVDEVVDLDEIFAEDKNRPPATSTGVVYVRDEEKERLTEALCRDVQVEGAAGADVEMVDVDGVRAQVLEGVEHSVDVIHGFLFGSPFLDLSACRWMGRPSAAVYSSWASWLLLGRRVAYRDTQLPALNDMSVCAVGTATNKKPPLKTSTIKTWTYTHGPSPQSLTLTSLPASTTPLSPTALQIRIHALALNPIDIQLHNLPLWSLPLPPFTRPKHTGCDFAGTVLASGPSAPFRPGDPVHGFVANSWANGTATEVLTLDIRDPNVVLARVPDGWGWREAAAVPLVWLTARTCVAGVEGWVGAGKGGTLGVLGGSSATGMLVVRLAKARGWRVVSSCAAGRNGAFVTGLGADVVVDYEREEVGRRMAEEGVDAVVDCVGGTECLGVARRYVTIVGDKTSRSALGGSAVYLWNPQMVWRWLVGWMGMGVRYDCVVLERKREYLEEAAKVLRAEDVVVDSVYGFEELEKAMEKVEKGKVRGKVVVEIK